jgi:methylamine dehydrogenase accessory protein MauD
MTTFMLTSVVFLWLAVAALGLIVVALARQVGILHERIAPVGALKVDAGIAVGEAAPVISLVTIDGGTVRIGRSSEPRTQLLLFVSPDCPICKKLLPVAKAFARAEQLSVVLIGDGALAAQRRMIERFGLEAIPFVNGPELGMRFGVGKLPYAVLIDDTGVIASAGLVNTREHLESLVVASEMGVPSVQAYLRSRQSDLAERDARFGS